MSTAEIKPTNLPALVSADELLVEYSDQRCELVEGKVKQLSPTGGEHGLLAMEIAFRMHDFVQHHRLGRCLGAETGFVIARNPDTVLAPDASFVRKERLDKVGVTDKYFPEAPALAVEVVSPSDTAEAVDTEARRWLAAGTEAVWVAYPKGKSITVYESTDNIRVLADEQLMESERVLPGFQLKVCDLFAELT